MACSCQTVLRFPLAIAGVTLLFTLLASPAGAQGVEQPTGAVVVELGGAAGGAVSFNYDVRYPSQFGFRLGATLDPREMDPADEPGETERDPDEPYSLLGLGHFFVGEGPFALGAGAGPVFHIEERKLTAGAAGHLGVRVQPLFERLLVWVGYSPAIDADGYRGFVGVGVGYEL